MLCYDVRTAGDVLQTVESCRREQTADPKLTVCYVVRNIYAFVSK